MNEPQTTQLQIANPPPVEPNDAMLALVERAARDPGVDVDKMERLLVMAEKVQARKAEAAFDLAMNACQAQMRPVANDSNNPQTRSRYASYGQLDRAVRPIYTDHGFSLSFGTRSPSPDRVTITCRVSHRAGHTERVEIDMPADGKGAKGGDIMSKTHATGSAVSYGMRYLLKMIFNIAVGEYDDDGNAAGAKRPAERSESPKPQSPAHTPSTPPSATQTTARHVSAKDQRAALDAWLTKCKDKLVQELAVHGEAAIDYAVNAGIILPNEGLADGTLQGWFPSVDYSKGIQDNVEAVKADKFKHLRAIQAQMDGEQVPQSEAKPSPMDAMRQAVDAPAKDAPTKCPHCGESESHPDKDFVGKMICGNCDCGWRWDEDGKPWEEHPWQFVICPVPPKGWTRAQYEQDPKTLGQLLRIDNKRAFGFIMNFSAEPREYKGKVYQPSAADHKFAEACEQARKHMNAAKPDPDDVPF